MRGQEEGERFPASEKFAPPPLLTSQYPKPSPPDPYLKPSYAYVFDVAANLTRILHKRINLRHSATSFSGTRKVLRFRKN